MLKHDTNQKKLPEKDLESKGSKGQCLRCHRMPSSIQSLFSSKAKHFRTSKDIYVWEPSHPQKSIILKIDRKWGQSRDDPHVT